MEGVSQKLRDQSPESHRRSVPHATKAVLREAHMMCARARNPARARVRELMCTGGELCEREGVLLRSFQSEVKGFSCFFKRFTPFKT